MNYRHIFHAGNFADILKHAVLTALLAELTRVGGPLTVIDTHAGAGLYDLADEAARRTGEASAGVGALMGDAAAPAALDALKAAVRRLGAGAGRLYPGSPVLIAAALRPGDTLIACEARPDDLAILTGNLRRFAGAQALGEDGWEIAARRPPPALAKVLVLIDPPYERGDDGARAARAVADVLRRNNGAVIAVWVPIKDLASYDALVGDLEDAAQGRPVLTSEVRLRPLDDPLSLNGCAIIVVNPPAALENPARQAADWVARSVGEDGALGQVWKAG